jgi:hypothetical protein
MGFALGFTMGMLVAVVLFGVVAWWVCSRSNSVAVAKIINGIAQALASKAKPPALLAPDENGEAMKEARGARKERATER